MSKKKVTGVKRYYFLGKLLETVLQDIENLKSFKDLMSLV